MFLKIYVQNHEFNKTKLYNFRKRNINNNINGKRIEKIPQRKSTKSKDHIDYKNLIYFKKTRILNRRQTRWILKIQDISYELIYRKDNENTLIDVLIRRKNKSTLENRKIFLSKISLKKIRENNFYFKINITEVKQEQEIWYYRKGRILINQEKKIEVMKGEHDDSKSRHSRLKKTLKRINQTCY